MKNEQAPMKPKTRKLSDSKMSAQGAGPGKDAAARQMLHTSQLAT